MSLKTRRRKMTRLRVRRLTGRDILRMQVDYMRGANDPGEPERYAAAKARIQEMAKGVLERMRKHYDQTAADAALKRVEDFRAMYPQGMKTAGPE